MNKESTSKSQRCNGRSYLAQRSYSFSFMSFRAKEAIGIISRGYERNVNVICKLDAYQV